ncbi:MAG: FtsH protease activity modulator HflK [Pseudomonadota bacterium]
MPINSSSGGGGPWGGGPRNNGGGRNPWGQPPRNNGGGGGGGGNGQGPDLDDLLRKGREQLRAVLGGGGGMGGGGLGGYERYLPYAIGVVLVLMYGGLSLYRVETGQQSVELAFGRFSSVEDEGLNFAPWPIITYEIVDTQRERAIDIGSDGRGERGLMLTGDENIVDIDFSVVWNVSNPADFLFNLAEPEKTITAVSESAMREVIAQSQLKPILSRDRAAIADQVMSLIQSTLNEYQAGVNIVRVNFDDADPPGSVIDAFRDVQAAEQERDTLEKRADADANKTLAAARGQVAQILQDAEAYRAQVVNEAAGQAARFLSVLGEYRRAPDVTRKRLYLETMERVFGDVDKVLIDESVTGGGGAGGQGVIPFLPLNELGRGRRGGGSQSGSGSGSGGAAPQASVSTIVPDRGSN